ncbi:MAG: prolyl oligopeptidase family serine peptidase, partial [Nitriliruptorales bacterium]
LAPEERARRERLRETGGGIVGCATGDELPPEERARRERLRETGGGIVGYATDREVRMAAFARAGQLAVVDVGTGQTRVLAAAEPVFDPRPDPTGSRVAYVNEGSLRVIELVGASGASGGSGGSGSGVQPDRSLAAARNVAPRPIDRVVAAADEGTWGTAEFIAAEEMGRLRGYWWSPDGSRLAVTRVDESPVRRWHISDPVDPAQAPTAVAYPAAGTANADVTLWVLDLDGDGVRVDWDRRTYPYLARVVWREPGPPTLLVQSRDQRTTRVLAADPDDGTTEVLREDTDPTWIELVDGAPTWLPDGRLVTTVDHDDTRRLAFDGEPVTPAGLQVRAVLDADDAGVLFTFSDDDPTTVHLGRARPDGQFEALTDSPGVHSGTGSGEVVAVVSASLERAQGEVTIRRQGEEIARIASHAATPNVTPRVRLLELGDRRLRAALLLPTEDPGGPLPVLLDPYGGPHAQRVVRSAAAHLASQWFADQGFAVLVIDGRGTPGRSPGWERAVHRDLAGPVLEDQVDGLLAAAETEPRLDLDRVAIRGWSFGGYLAALAVLRRPDVFRAAVAGAPVTDWRLYDTHYTERYLGHPDEDPDAYERTSLLRDAAALDRPLLLVHGMADDNVVVAHTLALSRALLEAGRPHTFLPLSSVTHMTPQEEVAENLLLLQLSFLRDALGIDR